MDRNVATRDYRGGQPRRPVPPRPRRRRVRPGRVILAILVVLLLLVGGFWIYLDASLKRVDALKDYSGRPAATSGTTWLLVGSDARDDLTEQQKQQLSTGDASGARTDTIMLLHIPSSGKATLISVPRDSYVDIPGNGKNKINAAFAFGGPSLLAQTVELATGVRVDHYAEIGFGGFAGVVDSIGGVNICIDQPMQDPKAGIDLKPGCQDLDGTQALGFVRSRAFARADLQRVENQRKFLSALMTKATSFGVLANPFRSVPLVLKGTQTLTVDSGDHLHNLLGLAFALGGGVQTATVPVASTPTVDVGSVVIWDQAKATRMFDAIRQDQQIPADLVQTGG